MRHPSARDRTIFKEDVMSARTAFVLLFLFCAACFGDAPPPPPPLEALPAFPPPVPAHLPDVVMPSPIVGDVPHGPDCPCPPPMRDRVACLTQGLLVPHEK